LSDIPPPPLPLRFLSSLVFRSLSCRPDREEEHEEEQEEEEEEKQDEGLQIEWIRCSCAMTRWAMAAISGREAVSG